MSDQLSRGPSWADVHVAIGQLERTWDVLAVFKLGRRLATKHSDQGLSVELLLTYRQSGQEPAKLPGLWSNWPHVDHRTMPGLMLKMVHLADERMHQLAEEKNSIEPLALFQ